MIRSSVSCRLIGVNLMPNRKQCCSHKHRCRVDQSGAGLVEMAIVLPLFLLLTAGLVDAARAILLYNSVSAAAREGVRLGIVLSDPAWGDATASNFCNRAGTYTPEQVQVCTSEAYHKTIVHRIMENTASLDPSRTSVVIKHGVLQSGWPIAFEITVSHEYDPIISAAFGWASFTVSGTSQMVVE